MVTVRIPATTANLGPGFDTLGMALAYYNYLTVSEVLKDEEIHFTIKGEGSYHSSNVNQDNLVMRSVQAAYDAAGWQKPKLAFSQVNNIPFSRGLGSSAAAIVGGLVAANALMGYPLAQETIMNLAVNLEGHADNVTAAILGGFVCVCNEPEQNRLYTHKIVPPPSLRVVVLVPHLKLPTKKSRSILPDLVLREDAVFNISHSTMLAVALQNGDLQTFGAMLEDKIHQSYRFALLPGAEDAVFAAKNEGALGCVLSGSGPSIIAFVEKGESNREAISQSMMAALDAQGIKSHILFLSSDNNGVTVIPDNKSSEGSNT